MTFTQAELLSKACALNPRRMEATEAVFANFNELPSPKEITDSFDAKINELEFQAQALKKEKEKVVAVVEDTWCHLKKSFLGRDVATMGVPRLKKAARRDK